MTKRQQIDKGGDNKLIIESLDLEFLSDEDPSDEVRAYGVNPE